MDDKYTTKDIWVGMCLRVLGEELLRVAYDPVSKKVFFVFDTPVAKGKAIEAVFASHDTRLALPVVRLQRAYEELHRYRYVVSEFRRSFDLKDVKDYMDTIFEEAAAMVPEVPVDLDAAISLLRSETPQAETAETETAEEKEEAVGGEE